MTIEEAVLENLKQLPYDKQKEILDFSEFLKTKTLVQEKTSSLKGIFQDAGIKIDSDDIDTMRKDLWDSFQ